MYSPWRLPNEPASRRRAPKRMGSHCCERANECSFAILAGATFQWRSCKGRIRRLYRGLLLEGRSASQRGQLFKSWPVSSVFLRLPPHPPDRHNGRMPARGLPYGCADAPPREAGKNSSRPRLHAMQVKATLRLLSSSSDGCHPRTRAQTVQTACNRGVSRDSRRPSLRRPTSCNL